MPAPQSILDLVETFERNKDSYLGDRYNETQLRREFLDPFFIALGWDVNNTQGYAEAYKDVIHEDAIKIGSATKAPDYCFRIGGARKFFLEAKKPSIDIKGDPGPAYQLRRYAWSAKLPLSILSDFQELAVYDCRVRPVLGDKSSTARIKYYTYADYVEKWDEIAAIFSREAVLKGSFDKFADSAKLKKGTTQVDQAFLTEIESWRDDLAHNIALRNPELTGRDLNFAVQITIDRMIFLRICEDRGIERYGELQSLLNGQDVYERLLVLFRKADDRYNSGLFHFNREKDRPDAPDELTPKLSIDDKILKDIIKRQYYPESPYEFSVLPAEILGQVYEQFLGKVITLTTGHRAKVEDKPEVKKAGGVFYTPSYIVDYIVENTVGKLVEGKTPKEVEKIKILDPACGSGSFLLGAFQFLLDWHLKWYLSNEPEKWAKGKNPPICVSQEPKNPRTHEHKNKEVAFGGDDTIPPRRCATVPLEKGESCKTDSSAAPRNDGARGWMGYKLTRDCRKRILLNTLFGVDIDSQAVEVTKLSLLLKVLEGEKELNLFAKERALPNLEQNIKCGNSLIGPDFYHNQQLGLFDDEQKYKINAFDWKAEFKETFTRKNSGFDAVIGNPPYIPIESMADYEREYYTNNNSFLERKYDTSVIFIASMLNKLNAEGLLSFISSVTWQTGQNYSKLRKHLFASAGIVCLINLPFDVFKDAYVDTGVYVISKKPIKQYLAYQYPKKVKVVDLSKTPYTVVDSKLISSPDYKIVLEPRAVGILTRCCNSKSFTLLGNITTSTQGLSSSRYDISTQKTNKYWLSFLEKGQVYRYSFQQDKICYANLSDKQSLINFYEAKSKILIRRVINRQDRIVCTYFEDEMVFKKDINPFIFVDKTANPYFALGILNSRLFSYLYINTSSIATKDDFRQTTLTELREMPVPVFMSNKVHHKMVSLVEAMLDLHKKLAAARTPNDKTRIQRQITATDDQIDRLVYELYGLTEDEIKIVEESGK